MNESSEEDFTPRDEDAPPENVDTTYEDSLSMDDLSECLFDDHGQGELFQVATDNPHPDILLRQQMKHDAANRIRGAVKEHRKNALSWERVEILIMDIWNEAFVEGKNSKESYLELIRQEDTERFSC